MAPMKTQNPEFSYAQHLMCGSSPTFFHSPAVVALARGAVLIGVLAVLFWGVHLHHRPGGKADGCSGKTD